MKPNGTPFQAALFQNSRSCRKNQQVPQPGTASICAESAVFSQRNRRGWALERAGIGGQAACGRVRCGKKKKPASLPIGGLYGVARRPLWGGRGRNPDATARASASSSYVSI